MQILALTVSGVTLFTLEAAEEKKKGEFLQRIRQLHGKTSSILCIDVLLSSPVNVPLLLSGNAMRN